MELDGVRIVSIPEVVLVIILGVILGVALRHRSYALTGLSVGLLAGGLFFFALTVARILLYPESPALAALRLFTWGLLVLYFLSAIATVLLIRRRWD